MSLIDSAKGLLSSFLSTPEGQQIQAELSSQAKGAIASQLNFIELRTGIAPPVRFTGQDLASLVVPKPVAVAVPPPAPGTRPTSVVDKATAVLIPIDPMKIVRPTLVVDSPLFGGTPRVYSTSAGVASATDHIEFRKTLIMYGLLILGTTFMVGYGTGKRRVLKGK